MELKKGIRAEQLVFISEVLERREEHWFGNSEERGWKVPLRSRTCGKGSRERAGPLRAWEEPRKSVHCCREAYSHGCFPLRQEGEG